jgi:hypothetical protein
MKTCIHIKTTTQIATLFIIGKTGSNPNVHHDEWVAV